MIIITEVIHSNANNDKYTPGPSQSMPDISSIPIALYLLTEAIKFKNAKNKIHSHTKNLSIFIVNQEIYSILGGSNVSGIKPIRPITFDDHCPDSHLYPYHSACCKAKPCCNSLNCFIRPQPQHMALQQFSTIPYHSASTRTTPNKPSPKRPVIIPFFRNPSDNKPLGQ